VLVSTSLLTLRVALLVFQMIKKHVQDESPNAIAVKLRLAIAAKGHDLWPVGQLVPEYFSKIKDIDMSCRLSKLEEERLLTSDDLGTGERRWVGKLRAALLSQNKESHMSEYEDYPKGMEITSLERRRREVTSFAIDVARKSASPPVVDQLAEDFVSSLSPRIPVVCTDFHDAFRAAVLVLLTGQGCLAGCLVCCRIHKCTMPTWTT
jgi:hypothetical protein